MLHFHEWTDWNITERGRVVDYCKDNVTVGSYITQSRHCLTCGRTQVSTQSDPRIRSANLHLVADSRKEMAKHDPVR